MRAWRDRFKLARHGAAKEGMFAIGDYAAAPAGETPEDAKARRAGGRFTLAEARDETPAHVLDVLTTAAKQNGLTVVAEAKRAMSGVYQAGFGRSTLRARAMRSRASTGLKQPPELGRR